MNSVAPLLLPNDGPFVPLAQLPGLMAKARRASMSIEDADGFSLIVAESHFRRILDCAVQADRIKARHPQFRTEVKPTSDAWGVAVTERACLAKFLEELGFQIIDAADDVTSVPTPSLEAFGELVSELAWEIAVMRVDGNPALSGVETNDDLRRTTVAALNFHGWPFDGVPGVLPHIWKLHEAGEITIRSAFNGLEPLDEDAVLRYPKNHSLSRADAELVRQRLAGWSLEGALKEQETSQSGTSSKRPLQQQQYQEEWILRVIAELGHVAIALPKVSPGMAGVKTDVRNRLQTSMTNSVFRKAWERLRADGRIRDAD